MSYNPVLENKVSKQLNSMAFSTAMGMFAVLAFNLADTIFVARLGVNELAAISFTPPIIFSLSSLTIGIAIGVSVVVSKFAGIEDFNSCSRISYYGILLSLSFSILFSFFGLFTMAPLFTQLGAKDEVLILVKEYMSIWYISFPLGVIPIIGNGAIRGLGDAKFPAMLMIISAVINIILDPLLIYGIGFLPKMGIIQYLYTDLRRL